LQIAVADCRLQIAVAACSLQGLGTGAGNRQVPCEGTCNLGDRVRPYLRPALNPAALCFVGTLCRLRSFLQVSSPCFNGSASLSYPVDLFHVVMESIITTLQGDHMNTFSLAWLLRGIAVTCETTRETTFETTRKTTFETTCETTATLQLQLQGDVAAAG